MTARLKRLARDTAIVIAVSLGLLVGMELLVRLFAPQTLEGTSVRGAHFSAPDSILGYRYLPEAVWRFRHPEYQVEYAINADGFRDTSSHPVPKPPGARRLLLLGDSFTFGQGVTYDETWTVRAEHELARRGETVDLVKAGVQGMDTRTELVLLRRLGRRLAPDLVVVGWLVNDLYTNIPWEERPDTELPDSTGRWADVRSRVFVKDGARFSSHLLVLARRLVTSNDAAYLNLYLAAPDRGGFLRVPLGEAAERQLHITEGLLRHMAAYSDSIGARLVVLSIPQQFQVLYRRSGRRDSAVDVEFYDRHFSEYAARHGFTWVPTLDAFAGADTGSVDLFYRLDGHLTPAGNAVLAREFLDRVVPLLAEPHPAAAGGGVPSPEPARGTSSAP